ncbi:hypothetical protein EIN_000230 [Entamoeba invadens IP1]|uniref:Uncharacterized protein n=1 Tax=Entamoeba invadens IP1 TaxID=370355 RepID=L7FJY4_ENTIV|nr:hypothetical protein EIN_000230 [Entamoeba invadens IP1]ELP83600.1 hypothetical protein EIN_000230 [Entamoeba invadens IP1]|eukprot:XP_004182946.1 hypothetical protein EIN_000230 [Entamoeba invadens IP1]
MAEKSVLERINTVFEFTRMMIIAENMSSEIKEIVANNTFKIFELGGDLVKEIKLFEEKGDLLLIVQQKINEPTDRKFAAAIVKFLM